MKKFLDIFKEVIERYKSPISKLGIISILGIVFSVSGVNGADLNTWSSVWELTKDIFSNPYVLFTILFTIFTQLNNPKNRKGF